MQINIECIKCEIPSEQCGKVPCKVFDANTLKMFAQDAEDSIIHIAYESGDAYVFPR